MNKKAEIKRIVLDLEGTEIGLSVEQAKKLHKLLDDMFGDKAVIPGYGRPIIIERHRPYWDYYRTIWSTQSSDKLEYKPDQNAVLMSVSNS